MGIQVNLSLLSEFPYKSFIFTAILMIMQYETTFINDYSHSQPGQPVTH